MRIGFVGLALSHPYTFAHVLAGRGSPPAFVWDNDPDRARDFAASFGTVLCDSPEAMAEHAPDGVMVCGVAANHVRDSLPFLLRGIPTFIDRPLAVNGADLASLVEMAEQSGAPLLSSSILRFGEAFRGLLAAAKAGDAGTVLGATATICHDIGAYLQPGNTWQDDPALGGGSLVTMGLHGLELVAASLGTDWHCVSAVTSRRRYSQSLSEDMAVLTLQYGDGRIATVHVVCGGGAQGYSLTLFGSDRTFRAEAPSGGETLADYGYTGTVDRFLEMIRTRRSPVPLRETRTILEALLHARLQTWPTTGR